MKNAIIAGLLFGVAHGMVMPIQAQQVTEYQTCTRYREVYSPGHYDRYGNYVQGKVSTESYKVPCSDGTVSYQPRRSEPVRPRRYCDPAHTTLGALLGGGVGAALSRGDGRYWAIPVGAAVGGGLFGCNY